MNDFTVVIPARWASRRFPGKPLALLLGRPMVEWCWRAAEAAGLGPVLVATEDERIAAAVRKFGGEAVMTSPRCASGTDRVHEASRVRPSRWVVNLQGDQPLIAPETLRRVARVLREDPKADIATAVIPLKDESRAKNPNVVKAVLSGPGKGAPYRALYFSRSPVPYPREGRVPRHEHLGIYGFSRKSLDRFVRLSPSPLERTECLEQLRALENGMSIYAAQVEDYPVAVDTPADLRRAARLARLAASKNMSGSRT